MLDSDLIETPLGDVFDRAFVADRGTVFGEDGAGIFGDPDDVAVSATHLRLEARHRAARFHDLHEFFAPIFRYIQLGADVVQGTHQLLRRVISVDVCQRRVGIDEESFNGGAEYSFNGVIKQAVITPFGLAQGVLGAFAFGDVLNEPFECDRPAVFIEHARPSFPNPTGGAVVMDYAVFEVEGSGFADGTRDGFSDPHAVVCYH